MKIAAIVWGSDFPLLTAAATREGVVLSAFGVHDIGDPTVRERFLSSQDDADLILLHPSQDAAWDILIPRLRADIPIVSFGHNQEFWTLSTVPIKTVAAVSAYVTHGGEENYCRMLQYLQHVISSDDAEPEPPAFLPWEGIYHPDAPEPFAGRDAYLETEGWLEDRLDGADGQVQGGAITIMTLEEIRASKSMKREQEQ